MRTVVAYGSEGAFGFRADTGEVVWSDPGYDHVTCVDVEDWWDYYGRPLPDMVDVLGLAYWHDGGYEPAEVDFRAYLSREDRTRSDNNG